MQAGEATEILPWNSGHFASGEDGHLEEEEILSDPRSNPFHCPPVLEVLFKHCTVKKLKTCRLVCRQWYSLSFKSWKQKVKIELFDQRKIEKFVKSFKDEDRVFEAPYLIPSNYVLKTVYDSNRLFEACGQYITNLTLNFEQNLQEFCQTNFRYLQNLKNLTLNRCSINFIFSEDASRQLPLSKLKSLSVTSGAIVSWSEFLNHFCTINSLCVYGGWRLDPSEMLRAIIEIRLQDPSKLNLKHVKFYGLDERSTQLVTTILMDERLLLETIDISLGNAIVDATCMKRILRNQRTSLKLLAIYWCTWRPMDCFSDLISTSRLEKLETLCFDSLHGIELMKFLKFLKWAPNLKKLKIDGKYIWPKIGTEFLEINDFSFDKCLVVEVDRSNPLTAEELKWFGKWFPNITHLTVLYLDNKRFSLVCELWPNLVSLVSQRGTVNDCGLTGLDYEDVRKIRQSPEGSSWRPITVPRANLTSFKHLPYINDLEARRSVWKMTLFRTSLT